MTEADKPETSDAGETAEATDLPDVTDVETGSGPGWITNASFGEGPGSGALPSYPSPGTFPEPAAGDTAAFGYPVGEYGSWNREPESSDWSAPSEES